LIHIYFLALSLCAAEPYVAPPPLANEPATTAEAKMVVERLKHEIAQEEKSWSEETTHEKEAIEKRKKKMVDFTQDRIKLQQSIAEQEQKLKESLAKMEAHQLKEKELNYRFNQLSQCLGNKAGEVKLIMAKGIPYRLDKRVEALSLLIRDIQGSNISTEEALNRLWTIEQNERRLAQEAEVYSGDFTEGAGEPVQVKYLRIGKQLLTFSSLDGSKLGLLRPETAPAQGFIWVRESEMNYETRQALKQAIATAEGKSLPGFVPMPIWKASFPALASLQSKDELPAMGKGAAQ